MHESGRDPQDFQALIERLRLAAYTVVAPLDVTVYWSKEPLPFADRREGKKKTVAPGQSWGGLFDCGWFHFTGTVPVDAKGSDVVFLIDVNGEGAVVDAEGTPVIGVTCIASEYDYRLGQPGKRVVPFRAKAGGGERIDFWMDAGANDLFGNLKNDGTLKHADIAVRRRDILALAYDVETLDELARVSGPGSLLHERLRHVLDRVDNLVRTYAPSVVAEARKLLAVELDRRGGDHPLAISAIGHAHMDLAWLWPIRETRRKIGRTFATALRMMERYPEYVFGASQPQQFAWLKEDYPKLYAQVKKRIADGRLEAQGAMWVEADTNLSGGEALVRQILYGKRFFRQEFGKDPKSLWLPDVFGYAASLPQIMKKAGVDYFMTIKLSWSRVNRFPHHTFLWEGVDGSRVLAHMPPEGTYNSSAAPRALAKIEREYAERAISEHALMLFGIGDGGGGPGEEHLERLKRNRKLFGLPPVKQELSATFFRKLAAEKNDWPVWAGELYLEFHQGVFTSQARSKRGNRQMEWALRNLEIAAARRDAVLGRTAGDPKLTRRLEALWKETLLYQFHDILPGSAINRVYEESLERYDAMLSETTAMTRVCDVELAARVAPTRSAVAVNDLSWERSEWVRSGRGWRKAVAPALGYAVLSDKTLPDEADGNDLKALYATATRLSNGILTATFNRDGTLASLVDHRRDDDEAVAGPANTLFVYEDEGDAWDFKPYYRRREPRRFALERSSATVDGPNAVLRQVYKLGQSTLTQDIVLSAGGDRLEFRTTADWRERGSMLRAAFPLAVFTREASCDIPYAHIKRPTHRNTSWDHARDEIACQKWIDLSESHRGVALLNDGKYGHRAYENTLELALLRSPSHPDREADLAIHTFTYALFPHAGDVNAGGVNRAACELNCPLRVVQSPTGNPGDNARPQWSFAVVDAVNILVETVKRAEEDPKTFIVRLCETAGSATETDIRFGIDFLKADVVDLMEENPSAVKSTSEGVVRLFFKPFEILTLRLRLRR